MSELLQKQFLFCRCLARWIEECAYRGYACTIAEAGVQVKRKSRMGIPFKDGVHMAGSLHYSRLAVDMNLFVPDDRGRMQWVTHGDHQAWVAMGEFWESLDPLCVWGGRFDDANHLSITHHGRK